MPTKSLLTSEVILLLLRRIPLCNPHWSKVPKGALNSLLRADSHDGGILVGWSPLAHPARREIALEDHDKSWAVKIPQPPCWMAEDQSGWEAMKPFQTDTYYIAPPHREWKDNARKFADELLNFCKKLGVYGKQFEVHRPLKTCEVSFSLEYWKEFQYSNESSYHFNVNELGAIQQTIA